MDGISNTEKAKQLAVVILASGGVIWYSRHGTQSAEDLSILLASLYFVVVIVLCKLLYWIAGCATNCRRYSLRRKARVYLYANRPRMFRRSIGESLDFAVTVLSVASCIMYIVETYMPFLANSSAWQLLELMISLIFLADYVLRFWLAYDPLTYALSTFGIINVITVLPVVVYTCDRLVKVHVLDKSLNPSVGSGAKLTYLRLLRLAKLMRILRSMNVIQTTSSEGLRRELFTLVFTVLCMIFSAAGVYQWLENAESCFALDFGNTMLLDDYNKPGVYSDPGCIYFHEAFYWCTITVLGRPRMIMQDHWTILMLIGLVAMSVVLIPRQIASVLAEVGRTSTHQRAVYKASSSKARHVVVVGHKEFAAVNMLLYELFHPDRGDHPVQDVVLLFPQAPDRDMVQLLAHPAYVGHATYVQGSPLQEKDLERASIGTAAGVIVLANKDSENPRWHDGELLTCIQAMKAYWLKGIVHTDHTRNFTNSREVAVKRLRPRIVTQVLLPETKEYLIELPGWTDRDVVVVCTEYVAWMTAMATMARGMATVVFNLTSHAEKQRFYRTKWYPRYEEGASHEIYSLRLGRDNGFEGSTTAEAANILATHRVLLIAMERSPEDGQGVDIGEETLHLFPGPADFKLQVGDRLFCISVSLPALRRVFKHIARSKPGQTLSGISGISNTISFVAQKTFRVSDPEDGYGHFDSLDGPKCPVRTAQGLQKFRLPHLLEGLHLGDHSGEQTMAGTPSDATWCDTSLGRQISNHGIPRGCEEVARCSSYQAEELLRNSSRKRTATDGSAPERTRNQDVLGWLQQRDPPWSEHIVICGLPQTQVGRLGGRGLVTELLETILRGQSIGPRPQQLARIYVMDDDAESRLAALCMLEPMLEEAARLGQLRAVSSDPRRREKLLHEACVATAIAVVALPEQVAQAQRREMSTVEAAPKMLKQVLDTNTVLTMQVARGCSERVRQGASWAKTGDVSRPSGAVPRQLHGVTLLLQESTSNLFFGHAHMRHAGAAACDPRWMDISPLNMSPLFASGELLAMTCFDRFAVEAFFTPQVVPLIRMFLFGDALGNRLYQISCPDDYCGQPFSKLVEELIPEGQIPLGLLRSPDKTGSTFNMEEQDLAPEELADLPDAALPYVITNPIPEKFVLRKTDFLFIVGDRSKIERVSWQNRLEQSTSHVATIGEAALERQSSPGTNDDVQSRLADRGNSDVQSMLHPESASLEADGKNGFQNEGVKSLEAKDAQGIEWGQGHGRTTTQQSL